MFNSIDHYFNERVQFSVAKTKNEFKNNHFKGLMYRKIAAKSIEYSSTKSVTNSDSDKELKSQRFNHRKSNIEICNLDDEINTNEEVKSMQRPVQTHESRKNSISNKKIIQNK